ncbi:MAG: hypothetical protein HOW73_32905 [Polyangiaceae bacterium]|nr:hypothetical protein [Polyangiaceae bacterium]
MPGDDAEEYRSLAMRAYGNYVVCVHGNLAPSSSEWAKLVRMYRAHPSLADARTLVYTDGGAPNAAQRADLSAVIGPSKMLTSIITHSVIARAAGTALTWLNPGLRVFSPADFDKALDHIGALGIDRRTLRDIVDDLRRVLSTRAAG